MHSKAWIRGPLWDSFWIVNGPALGAMALLASRWVSPFYLLLVPAVFLQKAHNLAPIVHAWGRSDFREVMLRDKTRFVWIPLALLTAFPLIGLAASLTGIRELFYGLLAVIAIWNLHHFAAQNFGLLSLYRRRQGFERPGQRRLDKLFCFFMMLVAIPLMIWTAKTSPFLSGMTFLPPGPGEAAVGLRIACITVTLAITATMVALEVRGPGRVSAPRVLLLLQVGLPAAIGFWQPLFFWTSVAVNHWFASVGINGQALMRQRPNPRVLLIAFAGYLMLIPFSVAAMELIQRHHLIEVGPVVQGVLFAFFPGQSAVHFLYDRHLFKLSRPEVRETIGRDLLPA